MKSMKSMKAMKAMKAMKTMKVMSMKTRSMKATPARKAKAMKAAIVSDSPEEKEEEGTLSYENYGNLIMAWAEKQGLVEPVRTGLPWEEGGNKGMLYTFNKPAMSALKKYMR